MVKDWIIPVAIVVIGLIVYNMVVARLLPSMFEADGN